MSDKFKKNGFTLVELSIVLVIIGLIIGGVVGGQSLIQSSKVRSIVTDFSKYQSATNMYVDKYDAMPGDHAAAFDYFGTNCAATAGACNGNGNFLVREGTNYQESFMFFKHLALAGFIEGYFTGTYRVPALIGTNVPTLKYSSATFWPYGWGASEYFINGTASGTPADMRTILNAGKVDQTGAAVWNIINFLKPSEAQTIDTKMDDGTPGKGKVLGAAFASGCSDTNAADTAKYVVSSTSQVCRIGLVLNK